MRISDWSSDVCSSDLFRHSLRSELPEKALARHAEEDFHKDLLAGSVLLLSPSGRCCFILPPEGAALMEVVAHEMGMVVRSRVDVYSKAGGKLIRQVITLEQNDAGTDRDVRPATACYTRGLHHSGSLTSGSYNLPVPA